MRRVSWCALGLTLVTLFSLDHAVADGNGRQNVQRAILRLLARFDLTDNSEFSQQIRELSNVKSEVAPRIDIVVPAPGDEFSLSEYADGIPVVLQLTEWDFRPDLAVNAIEQFANGNRVPNQGHLHVWIEDPDRNVVVFLGANAREEQFVTLEPGTYKAYAQLQNNDHTAQIQPAAPVRPAFDAVSFTVTE